ncbi:MAG TPA: efflux RND transporter periplasmic adaptor subunit [Verrucomicrobiae bacterium]|nr:efflux RND transporter periplasmic adaptor subunit [Verrucomicrobiae bacterium]
MKTFRAILVTLIIAIPLTWFATTRLARHDHAPTAKPLTARKLLYYQSAMHPWIKSDKPGRCTICGMELTPVYEGDADPAGGDVVSLSQSMIQALHVQTAEVQKRPIEKTLAVAGTIDDSTTRHKILSAYVPGRIEKLYVSYIGAEVKEGQPLAEFYSPNLLQAEREYRSLTGELRAATAVRLRQMGLTAAQIEALPNKPADKLTTQIVSPVGGTVMAQTAFEGQYVQEGEKLFEIGDFSKMWFQFRAYEQDLSWIKVGQRVDITTPSVSGKTFAGNITFIDPNFDPVTRSTNVRVELDNPLIDGRRLLARGVYADGVVHLDASEALAVPRSAVIQTGPQAVVYVEHGDRNYERKAVKLGRRGNDFVEIVTGVNAGEKVVTNGNLLIDGQAEMNRSFAEATHEQAAAKAPAGPLNDAQKSALADFIKANDAVSAALAGDDLAAFNNAGPSVMSSTDALITAMKGREDVADILSHVAEARHLHGAKDLLAARKMFHPFANAAAKTLEMLNDTEGVPPFQIFECPMVNKAIPDAPSRGRWIEAADRALQNPYFGKEMLDCGKRIIP